jgi:PadR family transcriptional regulator, regulatory protein AphA
LAVSSTPKGRTVASGSLTTTSYAVLGLLAIRPWTTYELTRQMDRSLGHMWPRATSKLYEEPKKLVAHGFARAREEAVGRRGRTVYSITPRGRRALANWLGEPGQGPTLEFEQLLKVFFCDHATTTDTLATLAAARAWAEEKSAASSAIGRQYLAGAGPFPERLPQQLLTASFMNEFFALVHRWATWAAGIVNTWPDDPTEASVDRRALEEMVERSESLTSRSGDGTAAVPDRRHGA